MKIRELDLRTLHSLALGKTKGKRPGRTFYQCSLIVGAAELGNDVVVLLPYLNRIENLKPIVKDLLRAHHIKLREETETTLELQNNQRIIFVSRNSPEAQRGYNHETTAFIKIE